MRFKAIENMKTTNSSLKNLIKYLWSFIQPWEHYVSSDVGYEKDKGVTTYWKKHKRKGIYVIYKMEDII
jgi:hypothetical protein